MSTNPDDGEPLEGVVVPGPWQPPAGPPEQDAPPPQAAPRPVSQPGQWRAIIPEHLSSLAGIRKAAGYQARKARHHALWHLVRLPQRLVLTVVWAGVGVARIVAVQLAWWWVSEQTYLRHEAIAANDPRTWMTLHKHAREARLIRGLALLAELIATALVAGCVSAFAPWAWPFIGLAVVPLLAWTGRPASKPILTSAVVPVHLEPLTEGVILRALGSIGHGGINSALLKDPDGAIVLVDPISRDGPGWLARADLPYGVTASEVMDSRDKLASGLRRSIGCVWPENERKRHPGALALYVGDEDMSAAEQPRWPLAVKGTVDMFAPAPFATDQRGRIVTITLMFVSIIIGAVPRMGKTFLLRLILLLAALDVRAELHAYDFKGTGDLSPVKPVAHRYRAGDLPEDLEYAIADWRALRRELQRRAKVIREISEEHPELCRENKVTPELASRKDLGLHPIVLAVDECQVPFEHKDYGAEFTEISTDLAKRGPALGILQALATQRPDAKSVPSPISAAAVVRMCLKVMTQIANDQVLGQSAHKSGYKATMFDFEDKGIFYFAGEGSAPRICRGFEIDGPAARDIVARARVLREAAGRLTGYALGQDTGEDARSFAADVLAIFGDAKSLWCKTIAERLAGSIPAVYADITPAAVSSQLRALGVAVKNVREPGKTANAGCTRDAVSEVAG